MTHIEYNHSLVITQNGWLIGIDPEAKHGYFENERNGSGGELWFDDSKTLIDYDGMFDLPRSVKKAINQLDYSCDWDNDD